MMLLLIKIIIFSISLSIILLSLIKFLSKKLNFNRELASPFECGFSTKIEGRFPFSLRFFLVALIFLIFDVELLLLFPYISSVISGLSMTMMFSYYLFLSLLFLGLLYEWNNLMLEWIK